MNSATKIKDRHPARPTLTEPVEADEFLFLVRPCCMGMLSFKLLCMSRKMSIVVEVAVLSGKTAAVEVGLEETVGTLAFRASAALGIGRGQLVNASGSALTCCCRIKDAPIQDGELLTMHVNRVQACATTCVFAAILGGGSVVTWGRAASGGDSSAAQAQLQNVLQINATDHAFAAILADGSVVVRGDFGYSVTTLIDAGYVGSSSAEEHQFKNLPQVQASRAICCDGFAVTWRGVDTVELYRIS